MLKLCWLKMTMFVSGTHSEILNDCLA